MNKWWIGAALAAMCVGQSAWGQYPAGGGGLLPEPAPVAPSQVPGQTTQKFMPGPLPGDSAPHGPDDGLSLPADIGTAWGHGPMPESGVYFNVGGMALMRQRPGRGSVATTDMGFQALTTHDLDPSFSAGGRATLGYLYDDAAIEISGFYLPDQDTSTSATYPGHLGMGFYNPPTTFQTPNGNGLWAPTDFASAGLRTSMGDAELNYRWWSRAFTGLEGIFGFRFVALQERATLYTDDSASGEQNSGLDPRVLQATYMARARNYLFLPQTGAEWNMPLTSWLSFGVIAKAGFGADHVEVTTRLTNALGFVGAQGRGSEWTYSSLYEIDAFLDLVTFEKMRIRAGYTAMWVLHVGEGFQQIDYNLAAQPGPIRDGGSIFYHGPMVEVQFLF